MSSVNFILNSIIHGKGDFCCLCLDSIQKSPINIEDETTVNINSYEHNIDISQVLRTVLGEEIYSNYIAAFNTLCEKCTKSAINSYSFMQSSKRNSEYLSNVLSGITSSFEYTTNEFQDSKSLYVSLNLHDLTSKHYYDATLKGPSKQAAFQRFSHLDTEKIETDKLLTATTLKNSEVIDGFKCKECFSVFPNNTSLKNHYVRVHAPKSFKCSQCLKKFGTASHLRSHQIDNHCLFVCSECGKTFHSKSSLKMHESSHDISIVCPDCGRMYKNKYTYRKHKELNICGKETRAHPSEAKYTCDYCNKKYTQKVSLRVHIQHEHGNYKSHICEWCGKKFWAPSRLKAHIVKHTHEKKFNCTVCGGKFVSKESLLYHTRTHTGEKPYKCPHCDSRFLSASRRTAHVKYHHLEGAIHECDICHSKFSSKIFLKKHKKKHMESSHDHLKDTKSGKRNEAKVAKDILQDDEMMSASAVLHEIWPWDGL